MCAAILRDSKVCRTAANKKCLPFLYSLCFSTIAAAEALIRLVLDDCCCTQGLGIAAKAVATGTGPAAVSAMSPPAYTPWPPVALAGAGAFAATLLKACTSPMLNTGHDTGASTASLAAVGFVSAPLSCPGACAVLLAITSTNAGESVAGVLMSGAELAAALVSLAGAGASATRVTSVETCAVPLATGSTSGGETLAAATAGAGASAVLVPLLWTGGSAAPKACTGAGASVVTMSGAGAGAFPALVPTLCGAGASAVPVLLSGAGDPALELACGGCCGCTALVPSVVGGAGAESTVHCWILRFGWLLAKVAASFIGPLRPHSMYTSAPARPLISTHK